MVRLCFFNTLAFSCVFVLRPSAPLVFFFLEGGPNVWQGWQRNDSRKQMLVTKKWVQLDNTDGTHIPNLRSRCPSHTRAVLIQQKNALRWLRVRLDCHRRSSSRGAELLPMEYCALNTRDPNLQPCLAPQTVISPQSRGLDTQTVHCCARHAGTRSPWDECSIAQELNLAGRGIQMNQSVCSLVNPIF